MPSLAACRCLFRLMRRCFLGRWTCLPVSERFRQVWKCHGHLAPITKTIQGRRTRHAGHYWRSKDQLISDVLLWIPTYGCAKAGRPARTYIQQLCEDTGCSPKTCQRRWTIGRSGERGTGISVLAVRHNDEDDDILSKETLYFLH